VSLVPGPGPAAGEDTPRGGGDTGAARAGRAAGGRHDRPGNTAGAGPGNTAGPGPGNTAGAGPGNTAGAGPGNTAGAGLENAAGAGLGSAAGAGLGSAGDLSQEEILDLFVAATMAGGDPPPADADLEDWDDWDPRDLPGEGGHAAAPPGWGFEADGALDGLRPGPMLSEVADAAHVHGLRHVGDDELTGIIKAWRRITSWAAARELAAIAELARRRPGDIEDILDPEVTAHLRAAGAAAGASSRSQDLPGSTDSPTAPGLPELVSPFVPDELALALTMTVRAAEMHLLLAADLVTKLPMTAAALEAGLIDMVRARIIAEATRVLTKEQAAAVEHLILPRAEQQTSGQLRAALARAILAADPDAARRRREQAQREARVLRWREDAGTAALCGRDLPSAEVLAADQRISARARELKSAGLTGTMDELRARAYLDFLLGRSGLPEPGTSDPGAGEPAESAAGPDRADVSPARADAGPDRPDVSPAGADAGPDRPDVSPARADTGPDRPDVSPARADTGPDRPDVSPAGADAGPDRPDVSPAGADAGPGHGDGGADGPSRGFSGPYAGYGGRGTGSDGPATGPWPPGGPPGGLAARINVTVPLSTLLGTSDTPGEVAAFGPVDAELARELARAAGMHPATRWCVTVVGQHGQAVGHGCARGRHSAPEHSSAGPEGPAQDGPAPNGPRPHHPAPDSSRRHDPAWRGPAPDGPSRDGPSRDGPSRDGPSRDGPSRDGPSRDGPSRDGPSRDGPARDRPADGRAVPAEPLDPLNPLARAFLQRLRIRITPLAVGTCDHRNEEPGYKPSRLLRHLIEARTARCTAPGCRRPAAQCDQDHTIPYEAGARTCECNLGPLCRRHHRCKQAHGWTLEQPEPGVFVWITPARRRYTTGPKTYAT
jgi:hypothetical protein